MKLFAALVALSLLAPMHSMAAARKTHACASNNGGNDVAFVDVVVSDKGQKFLKLTAGKAVRHFVITREAAPTGQASKLEGWEVEEKTGKTLGASISMEVPARLALQGELSLEGKSRKVRCSRVTENSKRL